MFIRSSALRPSAFATACICLDKFGNDVFCGRIFHPSSGERHKFAGVTEMLTKLEEIYNRYGFPQATHEIRSFIGEKKRKHVVQRVINASETEVSTVMDDKIANKNQRRKATFIIEVLFRQNATWQGKIQWVEENKLQNFRSDLEMLKLMDDAIRTCHCGEDDSVKWD